jgi:hypothetical protein
MNSYFIGLRGSRLFLLLSGNRKVNSHYLGARHIIIWRIFQHMRIIDYLSLYQQFEKGLPIRWHLPRLSPTIYPYATLMAYNTALAFIACDFSLLALIKRESTLLKVCSLLLFVIALLTLLELTLGFKLNTSDWFVVFLNESPAHSQPMSPATASMVFSQLLSGWASKCRPIQQWACCSFQGRF